VNTIRLERVQYMPKELSPGILYISERYAVAGHLCACGCGNKVIVPLGPTEWSFTERQGLPSLWPSIGNWQLPCRSHYVIAQGRIDWAGAWSDEQILAGRRAEEQRREAYYAPKPKGILDKILDWLKRTWRELVG
jgi:hypothetical protein